MLPLGRWLDRGDELEASTSEAHVAKGFDVPALTPEGSFLAVREIAVAISRIA